MVEKLTTTIEIHEPELLKRVLEIFGENVHKRVIEQLSSEDYRQSCCSGLVAYLLGFQNENKSMSIDEFTSSIVGPKTIKSFADSRGDFRGNRQNSNVVIYQHPLSGFPWHVALYLGDEYEFGQWEQGKPTFKKLGDATFQFHRVGPKI